MTLRECYYCLLQKIDLKRSVQALRKLEQKLTSSQTRLGIPFIFRGSGFFRRIKPIQSQWEIGELFRRVCKKSPKTVLEIGTCHGGTLYLWCQAAQPDALLISLDLPGGQFGGGYRECRSELYQEFKSTNQQMKLIRADSHSEAARNEVRDILEGRKVDFLFIDADHTYQGVKRDFELYSPLVAPGGIIAFHDVGANPTDPCIEVPKFWNEIRPQFKNTVELLSEVSGDRRIGIGVIELPS